MYTLKRKTQFFGGVIFLLFSLVLYAFSLYSSFFYLKNIKHPKGLGFWFCIKKQQQKHFHQFKQNV